MLLTLEMLEEKTDEANEIFRVFTDRMKEEQRSSGGVLLAAIMVLVQQAMTQKVCDPFRFQSNTLQLVAQIMENTTAENEAKRVVVEPDYNHLRQ